MDEISSSGSIIKRILHVTNYNQFANRQAYKNRKYDKVEGFGANPFFPLCYLFGDVVIFFSSYNKNYTTTAPVRARFDIVINYFSYLFPSAMLKRRIWSNRRINQK